MSPGAATFKHEAKDCIQRLTASLAGAMARQDRAAINKALATAETGIKLCRMCPFQIGVVDPDGDILGKVSREKRGAAQFLGLRFICSGRENP